MNKCCDLAVNSSFLPAAFLGEVSPLAEEDGRHQGPEVEEGADPAGAHLDPQRAGALPEGLLRLGRTAEKDWLEVSPI